VSVLVLLTTGWLLYQDTHLGPQARDAHYLAGYVLAGGLLLRLYALLFGSGPAHWRDCIPMGQGRAVMETLRFYLSLGRSALPRWYAHNPLWGPAYLLLLALLAVQTLSSGFGWESTALAAISHDVHGPGAQIVGLWVLFHVIAVFMHEIKGTGGDVSAMINGHRCFVVERPPVGETSVLSLERNEDPS
jgi:Ni/Fe-hydrogenase 1 B-type cytochrome subunit